MTDVQYYKIGQYCLERAIGRGGQAQVFKARHESTGMEVALKFFQAGKVASENRVWDEEGALYALQGKSPHIIQIIDSYKGERMYHTETRKSKEFKLTLVLELAGGGTLYDLLRDYGQPPLAVSLGIFGQIVDAVRVCHENGLCHRDLKLENIMFDRYHSRILLVDFGLCSKTQGGLRDIVGSKGYICPEMLYERQHHGIAADAWSLGIILFTLLTHAHPWGHALDGRHIQFEKRREEFWSNPQFAHFTFQQKACLEALLVLNPGDRIQNLASLDIADLQRQFGVQKNLFQPQDNDFQNSLATWMYPEGARPEGTFKRTKLAGKGISKEQTPALTLRPQSSPRGCYGFNNLVNDGCSRCERSFFDEELGGESSDLSLDFPPPGGNQSLEKRYAATFECDQCEPLVADVLSKYLTEVQNACGGDFKVTQQPQQPQQGGNAGAHSCTLSVEEVVGDVRGGAALTTTEETAVISVVAFSDGESSTIEVSRLGGSRMVFDLFTAKTFPHFQLRSSNMALFKGLTSVPSIPLADGDKLEDILK